MRILLVAVLSLLAGCADWNRETRTEEIAYQVLSAVDTAQSYQAARRPECYGEGDPVTSFVVGNHPRPQNIVGWGIARAGFHAFVTNWMVEEGARPWALRTWQVITIGVESRDVAHNWTIGLRIGSANPPSYAPCRQRGF